MSKPPSITLSTGAHLPFVGFGTYLIKDEQAESAVGAALSAGYRHIDTAEGYQNESGVGRAIRTAMDGGLARDELFVTTKLWPGYAGWGQEPKNTETTIASCEASLERLGLDYVDLYLIHATFDQDQRIAQWRGMVALWERGLARAIGVSNFSESHIDELLAAGLPVPHANQIELHPWSQKPALVGYLADKGIAPIAYSSLVPLSTWRTAPGQDSAKTEAMREEAAKDDAPFRVMAEKYGVSEAQVLLRWAVQKGYPVLPKSTNPERIRANLDLFGFTLDDADMAAIADMDRGGGIAWSVGDPLAFS
ncbi:MAG: aldo/keto reductase [Deltaproteobacteria bacterium]|nr:MAG: aldo/keto reductase [Deltaproteobacteria bacterium]